jgi:hypothetical protein
MITWTVVAVLAVLLLLVLKKLFEKPAARPAARALPQNMPEVNLKVADARAGDSVSVSGAGDEFSDLDFTVEARNEYQAGARRWIELRGMYRDRRVMLEVSAHDELEVWAVTDARGVTLDELALGEADLGELDQRQNASDFFEFEGKNWYYRFSREFSSRTEGAAFYGWVFREEGTKRIMLLRKAEGEPFSAVIGVPINPGDVTVYRA